MTMPDPHIDTGPLGIVGAFVGGALLTLGVLAIREGMRSRSSSPMNGPNDWYRWRPQRRSRGPVCYQTKAEALQAFRDANRGIIDDWGGLDAVGRPADFDALNHKLGLKGGGAIRTLAQAMWHAMPPRRPFCLDEMDIDTLNETSPGQRGSGFQLPEAAWDALVQREQARHYRDQSDDVPF